MAMVPYKAILELIHIAHVGFEGLKGMVENRERESAELQLRADALRVQERVRTLREGAHRKLDDGVSISDLSDAEFYALIGHVDSKEAIARRLGTAEERRDFITRASQAVLDLSEAAEYFKSPTAVPIIICPDCRMPTDSRLDRCESCGTSMSDVAILPCCECSQLLTFRGGVTISWVTCPLCGSECSLSGSIPAGSIDTHTMGYLADLGIRHLNDIEQYLRAL